MTNPLGNVQIKPSLYRGVCTPESIIAWMLGKQDDPTISFPDDNE